MAISITPSDSGANIRIDGEFNIYTAAESKTVLMDALAAHNTLDVNIEAVEEIDTSGLQLLLLMQNEARRTEKTLTLSGLSPAIQDVVTLLNLADFGAASAGTEPTVTENRA